MFCACASFCQINPFAIHDRHLTTKDQISGSVGALVDASVGTELVLWTVLLPWRVRAVGASVGASAGALVGASVGASVGVSVGASVGAPVGASHHQPAPPSPRHRALSCLGLPRVNFNFQLGQTFEFSHCLSRKAACRLWVRPSVVVASTNWAHPTLHPPLTRANTALSSSRLVGSGRTPSFANLGLL